MATGTVKFLNVTKGFRSCCRSDSHHPVRRFNELPCDSAEVCGLRG